MGRRKKLIDAPGFRDVITLASNGIPYDVAIGWSLPRRAAALIALGEGRGRVFDWASRVFRDP